MAETTCLGCGGPIEKISSPGVIKASKSVKPATLAGKLQDEDDVAWFHAGCFHSQMGYERA